MNSLVSEISPAVRPARKCQGESARWENRSKPLPLRLDSGLRFWADKISVARLAPSKHRARALHQLSRTAEIYCGIVRFDADVLTLAARHVQLVRSDRRSFENHPAAA
jgi:hypothetical protein